MRALADVIDRLPDGAGPIGLLSGDEFTPAVAEFDRAVLARAGPRVAILPCADPRNAARNGALGRRHLAGLGAEPFVLESGPLPHPLPNLDVIYIGGGDPRVLLDTLHGDPGWGTILERWRAGAALVGSSAGAMALSEHCLVPEPGADKPTKWTRGLGPLTRVGLAVHATTRPRGWLQQVAEISRVPVLALDDATGVVLAAGDEPVVIGSGRAWLVDRAT